MSIRKGVITFLLVTASSLSNASTIYNLKITSGSRGYYDPTDFTFIGSTDVFGNFTISVSDDGQLIKYLDQSVTYIQYGSEHVENAYQNGVCAWQTTLDCKTLRYRAASSDYYYSFYATSGFETSLAWTESILFDGTTFTSKAMRNNGADTPFYFTYNASVTSIATPVPAAIWLFGSGLYGLFRVAQRKK